MTLFTDQAGHTFNLEKKPERIISIVPSQSEFLWDIGVRKELVGITKFCIHPYEMFGTVERVGGTKNLDFQKIRALKPDLIIGNKEENDRGQVETLQKEFNVWISDINDFGSALNMMTSLGTLVGREHETNLLTAEIKSSLQKIKNLFNGEEVAYFIWNDPYMCVAENTFIDHVLQYVGFKNVFTGANRYPEISLKELQETSPAYCFLSSEPFPFYEKHVAEMKKILPASKILIVDGEMFSWYGSRLLKLEGYLGELKELLNSKF